MNRKQAIPYVAYVVNGCELGANPHAIVRLVGWQCGFEPLFVAVHSYLDISDQEAEEMAADCLEEIGWFARRRPADYVLLAHGCAQLGAG